MGHHAIVITTVLITIKGCVEVSRSPLGHQAIIVITVLIPTEPRWATAGRPITIKSSRKIVITIKGL